MVSQVHDNLKTIKKVLMTPSKFMQTDSVGKACFSYDYKQYGAFETWELAWSKLMELPPRENVFHELIQSHNKVKPYLDIEWFQEKFPSLYPDRVLMTIKEKIMMIFKTDWDYTLNVNEIFVASCHRKKSEGYKYSFRVVISTTNRNIVFANTNCASFLAKRVIKEIRSEDIPEDVIDMSPYKKTQNIRLVGHSKSGEYIPMQKTNSGDNDKEFIITNISPINFVLDVPEQKDRLYKTVKNDGKVDSEHISEIVEIIKSIHPTATLDRIDANGFMQFNYTDRTEPCFLDPERLHDKIGFFAYKRAGRVCVGCHSGNCVDSNNKKAFKIIGSLSARTETSYERVGFDNEFKHIDKYLTKKCIHNGNYGISDLFQEMYLKPKRIKWTTEGKSGTSYFWDGNLWKEDDHSFLDRLVASNIVKVLRDYIDDLNKNSDIIEEGDLSIKEGGLLIKKLNDGQNIHSVLKFLKPLVIDNEFSRIKDIHPYLLSCKNGVVDLKTGELRACVPSDNMTKRLDIIYDKEARTEEFDTFVKQITSSETGEDLGLYNYLKWSLGYAMQGAPVKKMFFILYGERGYNGKSMILNTIKGILGYYAVAMDKSVIVNAPSKTGGSHSSELCQLENIRAGILSETKEDEIINDAQIKMLTGVTDRISVREIYGKQKEILPTLVAFISSNHKLKINLKDPAMYERLALIPFRLSFLDNPNPDNPWERKGDSELSDKFDKNKEGVLKWLIDASLYYHQNPNLKPPPIALEAKQEYRKEMDDYANFVAKYFEITGDKGDKIKVAEVSQRYKVYHDEYIRPNSNRGFDRQKSEKIIIDYFGAPLRGKFIGVRFKEEEESDFEFE